MTTASLTLSDVRLRTFVMRALDWDRDVDDSAIGVTAKDGVVTLTGFIEVSPKPIERDVRRRIVQSLHHHADLDARHIDVAATGEAVTLTGTVGSWSQRDAAEQAAGSAPGIRRVDNQIIVVPPEPHELEPPDEPY